MRSKLLINDVIKGSSSRFDNSERLQYEQRTVTNCVYPKIKKTIVQFAASLQRISQKPNVVACVPQKSTACLREPSPTKSRGMSCLRFPPNPLPSRTCATRTGRVGARLNSNNPAQRDETLASLLTLPLLILMRPSVPGGIVKYNSRGEVRRAFRGLNFDLFIGWGGGGGS